VISRVNIAVIGVLCAGLAAGCGRTDRDEPELDAAGNDFDITQARPIVETGCLTESGGRFVLTALESGDGGGHTATELYQLVGVEDELRKHVGRAVRVTGESEPPRVAELHEASPPTSTGRSGTTGTSGTDRQATGSQPRVETESTTRIETQHLLVQSVTPTGNDCPEAGGR